MEIVKIPYPDITHLNEYQKGYVSMIPSGMDLLSALQYSYEHLVGLVKDLSEENSYYKYESNKWSIKQMMLHITDTERVFQYRALSIARGVTENLISYDENSFAANSNAELISFEHIMLEFSANAKSMDLLFQNLHSASFAKIGRANNQEVTPSIIGFMAAGHRLHHSNILSSRYLTGVRP